MSLWTETPTVPSADADKSFMTMDYVNAYGYNKSKVIEMDKVGEKVWLKDIAFDGAYIQGQILANGDMRFASPQYQGLISNFLSYAYAVNENEESISSFYIKLQDDGSYLLPTDVQIWAGESAPDYPVVESLKLTPITIYEGVPSAPENVRWNPDVEHFINFDMPMTGLNGEELPLEWMYWQLLINDEPYTFHFSDYQNLDWYLTEETDMMPANLSFYVMTDGKFMDWGYLGNNKFSCYLPAYSADDSYNFKVRSGYKVGDTVYWSDAIEIKNTSKDPNILPANAIYFTYAFVDTEYGPWEDSGVAMSAEYDATTMRLSGFFQHDGWIEGKFTDDLHYLAEFESGQIIGTTEDRKNITMIPAYASESNDQKMFTPLESFTLKIGLEGETMTQPDQNLYLLEVTDGEITNVWCPNLKFTRVNDKMVEIPDDAECTLYEMNYCGTYDNYEIQKVTVARLGDKVWLSDVIADNVCIEGRTEGNDLVFDLPQFVGVVNG